jgi:hypothetical protein
MHICKNVVGNTLLASASSHTTKLLIILCSAKLIRLRWLSLSNKPNLFVYAEGSRFGKIKRIFAFALDLFVSLADRLRYSRSAKSNKFAFALDLFVSLRSKTTVVMKVCLRDREICRACLSGRAAYLVFPQLSIKK